MSEFRTAYFARDYEANVAFYRDGLELPELESWDRGPSDRGTIFEAAAGRIEILALPEDRDEDSTWDYRAPAGVLLVIEIDDVEGLYERVQARGVPIKEALKTQSWGHRSFVVTDPDGLGLYFFTDESRG